MRGLQLTDAARLREEAAAFAASLRPALEEDPEWRGQGMLSDGDSREVTLELGQAADRDDLARGSGRTRPLARRHGARRGRPRLPLASALVLSALVQDHRLRARTLRLGGAKERLLRPIASGELTFCQGFSEPGAGSDLASLTTRAVADDRLVVSGHKIWTSSAWLADWIYLAVRTDTPSRRGIEGSACSSHRCYAPGNRGAAVPGARRRITVRGVPRRRRPVRRRTSWAEPVSWVACPHAHARLRADQRGEARWARMAPRRSGGAAPRTLAGLMVRGSESASCAASSLRRDCSRLLCAPT